MKNINKNFSILAEGITVSNDSIATGNNNNHLVIGSSGSGKTLSYVLANLLNSNESFIVTDCKGSLYNKCKDSLEKKGFTVHNIDFKFPKNSTIGYNPLDFISEDEDGTPSETDIAKIASIICPKNEHDKDPYWEYAAAKYLEMVIDYVLTLPKEERTMSSISKIAELINTDQFDTLMEQMQNDDPQSLCVRRWHGLLQARNADKTVSSILSVLDINLGRCTAKQFNYIFEMDKRLNFSDMGRKKTAVFVSVSDTDRSSDSLLSLFYSQAISELIDSADTNEHYMLDVPTRLYMDDFASSFTLPNADKIVSNIRSRNISCSIMIQSLSQLETIYSASVAKTISENCDTWLFLGSSSIYTADVIAQKINKTLDTVLNMPKGSAYVLIRGKKPIACERYRFAEHLDAELLL